MQCALILRDRGAIMVLIRTVDPKMLLILCVPKKDGGHNQRAPCSVIPLLMIKNILLRSFSYDIFVRIFEK